MELPRKHEAWDTFNVFRMILDIADFEILRNIFPLCDECNYCYTIDDLISSLSLSPSNFSSAYMLVFGLTI